MAYERKIIIYVDANGDLAYRHPNGSPAERHKMAVKHKHKIEWVTEPRSPFSITFDDDSPIKGWADGDTRHFRTGETGRMRLKLENEETFKYTVAAHGKEDDPDIQVDETVPDRDKKIFLVIAGIGIGMLGAGIAHLLRSRQRRLPPPE